MKLRVVLLCLVVALTEGFDIQAIGLAAPQLKAAFSISDSLMGLVLSSSTIGLFFGSFIGGRYSDQYGRRPMLIFALITFSIFTLGAAFSSNVNEVLMARFVAGIGFGAAMPNLIALMSENAPPDKKTVYVSAIFSGIALGGGIASAAMAFSNQLHDWRNLFILGGLVPLLCVPLLWRWLPESKAFLANQAAMALNKEKLPSVLVLFEARRIVTTLLLWVCFFVTLLMAYLLVNWLPSLVKTLGFTSQQAAIGAIFFNIGGAIGGVLGGMVIDRGYRRIGFIVMYAGSAAMAYLVGSGASSFEMVVLAEFLFGLFALGAQYGLYGISPNFYRTEILGTGVGTAIGIGRLGAVAGPIIMGMLMTSMQASGGATGKAIFILIPACGVGVIAMMALLGRKAV
jgi:AAHS family 3-hydroxyphenylpropionic acid transporter